MDILIPIYLGINKNKYEWHLEIILLKNSCNDFFIFYKNVFGKSI